MRSNFTHLYADFGVLAGSTLSFLAVYAARLGANGFQVGLLSAGPAVVNMLFSLPSGRWLENRPLIRVSFLAALWSRLGWALLLLLPVRQSFTLRSWRADQRRAAFPGGGDDDILGVRVRRGKGVDETNNV
jgi:hypothetical protein